MGPSSAAKLRGGISSVFWSSHTCSLSLAKALSQHCFCRLPGTQQVALSHGSIVQLEGILDAHVEVFILPVL